MKSPVIRLTLLGSIGVLVLNITLLAKQEGNQFGWSQSHPPQPQSTSSYIRIGSDFFSSFTPVEETISHHALQEQYKKKSSATAAMAAAQAISSSLTTPTTRTTSRLAPTAAATNAGDAAAVSDHDGADNGRQIQEDGSIGANDSNTRRPLRYSKMLMGIFSSDSINDSSYRKRHRTLLREIWKDPRTCTLVEYRQQVDIRDSCELIYTFIIGGNQNPESPTERFENNPETGRPIVLEKMLNPSRDDINVEDVTILNIRENMNDGKSPTFFYFATTVMEEFGNIDYAMKLDADAILHLHDYFLFAHEHLPPAPYNTNIFAGALRDKAGWPKDLHPPKELARYESFWGNEFEGVHLYLAGQCYLMSYDLAKFVAEEAPFSRTRIGKGGYLEGHEDHDVSAMAFHSPTPIHMITIGKSQRFWEHPVKGQPRWIRIEKRERARMSGQLFEGKILRLN